MGASWRPLGTFGRPPGGLWEAFWGNLHLGHFVAPNGPRSGEEGPETLPRRTQDAKRLPWATKSGPRGP